MASFDLYLLAKLYGECASLTAGGVEGRAEVITPHQKMALFVWQPDSGGVVAAGSSNDTVDLEVNSALFTALDLDAV